MCERSLKLSFNQLGRFWADYGSENAMNDKCLEPVTGTALQWVHSRTYLKIYGTIKRKYPYNSNKTPALKIALERFTIQEGSKKSFNKEVIVEHLRYTFLRDFLWDWLEKGSLR